jgi:DNA-3-methyladenine glycosylase II
MCYGQLLPKQRPPFITLTRSIVSQQVSTKAANTIRERLAKQIGLAPEDFVAASMPALRALGLSETKARCLRDVAIRAIAAEFDDLAELTNKAVTARLQQVRGIGPWTAEMFLIFALGRADVWPVTDAGLRVAASRLYGADSMSSLQQLGDRFRPLRTIAALYFWESLENT